MCDLGALAQLYSALPEGVVPTEQVARIDKLVVSALEKLLVDIVDGHVVVESVVSPTPATAPYSSQMSTALGETHMLTYEDFAKLAQRANRPDVPAFIRTWFKDYDDGFDGTTPEQRAEVFAKASAWADQNAGEPKADDNPMNCFRCGRPGDLKQRRDGGTFLKCPSEKCGFPGRDGWVQSMWDPASWRKKREQVVRFGR